jgi:hypothetical protein
MRRIKRKNYNIHRASAPCHPQTVTQITRTSYIIEHLRKSKYVFKGTPRSCAEYEEILRNRGMPKMYLAQELNATLSLLLTSTEARA